jgi:hypothetical protein
MFVLQLSTHVSLHKSFLTNLIKGVNPFYTCTKFGTRNALGFTSIANRVIICKKVLCAEFGNNHVQISHDSSCCMLGLLYKRISWVVYVVSVCDTDFNL